jgi:hypothetical protein
MREANTLPVDRDDTFTLCHFEQRRRALGFGIDGARHEGHGRSRGTRCGEQRLADIWTETADAGANQLEKSG